MKRYKINFKYKTLGDKEKCSDFRMRLNLSDDHLKIDWYLYVGQLNIYTNLMPTTKEKKKPTIDIQNIKRKKTQT